MLCVIRMVYMLCCVLGRFREGYEDVCSPAKKRRTRADD